MMCITRRAFSDTVTTLGVYNSANLDLLVDVNKSIFAHRLQPVCVLEYQVTLW